MRKPSANGNKTRPLKRNGADWPAPLFFYEKTARRRNSKINSNPDKPKWSAPQMGWFFYVWREGQRWDLVRLNKKYITVIEISTKNRKNLVFVSAGDGSRWCSHQGKRSDCYPPSPPSPKNCCFDTILVAKQQFFIVVYIISKCLPPSRWSFS